MWFRMRSASSVTDSPRQSGYTFGDLQLNPDGTLRRGDAEIHLPPKELAALRFLLARPGQIVTPSQLKSAIWGDVHVTGESVPRCISSLRTAMLPGEWIQTVYKRGYRFTATVVRHGGTGTRPRLAILPFVAGLTVPDYLGAAVADEASARLVGGYSDAQMPFAILARDSVFTLAQRGYTAQQVGITLGADYVLTGSLRAFTAHYRLRAEMIRVEDGAQVWVEDFLVPQSRVGGLETEAVDRLLSRLSHGAVTIAAVHAQQGGSDVVRQEAWQRFQQGRQEMQTLQRHRMQEGLQNLLRATELDPGLISAHIDLVNVCITQTLYGFMSPVVAAEQVRRSAKSIPDKTSGATAILPALGWVRFHVDRNLDGALDAFEKSADLPHDSFTTRSRVMFLLSRRRFDEALRVLEEAIQVDPYSPWLHARLGWALHLAGEAAKSKEQVDNALKLFHDHEGTNIYGATILAYNGETDRALELSQNLIRRCPYCDLLTAVHGYALARAGRKDEAAEIVERLQWASRERYVSSSFTSAISVELGDKETAVAELRSANEARCPWFFQSLADPRLRALEGVPEFARMRNALETMELAAARN